MPISPITGATWTLEIGVNETGWEDMLEGGIRRTSDMDECCKPEGGVSKTPKDERFCLPNGRVDGSMGGVMLETPKEETEPYATDVGVLEI